MAIIYRSDEKADSARISELISFERFVASQVIHRLTVTFICDRAGGANTDASGS